MYEVFPFVAGVVMGLVVPRFVPSSQRRWSYAGLAVVVAAAATILAGEEWFFIFFDLAFVLIALAVTLALVNNWAAVSKKIGAGRADK